MPHEEPPPPGAAIEVAEGILWMRLPLPMALDHVNVYALDDGADGWTVIDTGFNSRKGRVIWDALLSGPLVGRPVSRVIVTHHHPDHVGLAGWFQDRGARLCATRTAWLYARMLTLDVHDRPKPEAIAFWKAAGMDVEMLRARESDRPFNFADCVHPMPQGYQRLVEGQEIRIGGRDWTVRCGDGHAPEHATFWSHDDSLVIGGDQLLPGISANIGVYPTEPDADPLAEWIASCAGFLPHARASHLVLPGHKLPFTGLPTRLLQMIDNHEGALERLLDHLQSPRTAVECFQPLFRRPIGAAEYGLALVEAVAHLNYLRHAGQAARVRREDGAWLWRKAEWAT